MIFISVFFTFYGCSPKHNQSETDLQSFIDDFTSKIQPLNEKHQLAAYNASVSGDAEEYKNAADLQILIVKLFSNKDNFAKLKAWKESKQIQDSLLKRQLEVLYYQFLPNQANEQDMIDMVLLENEIERKFSTYRPEIDGKIVTDNQIDDILANSQNPAELEKYWKASKSVGSQVNDDIIKLVKLRNKTAKEAGFKNYREMIFNTSGEDPEKIDEIFEELDFATRGPYTQLKSEIDNFLSVFLSKPVSELKAWDYQNKFLQDAPNLYSINYDKYYKDADIAETDRNFYSGIGLDMSDIISKSDLFYKEKKQQLPYSIDIDRKGDIRISASTEKNAYSMYALLYETGFSASYKYINKDLPYLLKEPAHFIISDAGAEMFGQLATNTVWLETQMKVSKTEIETVREKSRKHQSISKFFFSRWSLVMYNFEKSLYEDPDQDLNELWWNLVEKYQMIKKPESRNEPDWASKPHLINQPCSYHNYMLGEMLAAQMKDYIQKKIGKQGIECETSCISNPEIGKFLKEKLYAPGLSVPWNILIKQATGNDLSADFFTKEYIDSK
jgi:peptidyl-dipeptidase A